MYSVTLFRQPCDAGAEDVGQLSDFTLRMYSVTLFRQPRDAGAADVGQLSDWYRRVLWLPIPSLHPLRKVTNLKLKQFFGGAMILLWVQYIGVGISGQHRRRIKTEEEKAKVLPCCLGDGIDSSPCRTSYFPPGWFEEKDEYRVLATWRNRCFEKMDYHPVYTLPKWMFS